MAPVELRVALPDGTTMPISSATVEVDEPICPEALSEGSIDPLEAVEKAAECDHRNFRLKRVVVVFQAEEPST